MKGKACFTNLLEFYKVGKIIANEIGDKILKWNENYMTKRNKGKIRVYFGWQGLSQD